MLQINEPTCEFDFEKFKTFCRLYDINFPQSLIDYLMKYNDADLPHNVIKFDNNECNIRFFYGTTNEDYSDISQVYEWYVDRLPPKCVPIADPDFGNQICMSVAPNNYGKIYFWDHETMDTDYDEQCDLQFEEMIFLADSLDDLFEKIRNLK